MAALYAGDEDAGDEITSGPVTGEGEDAEACEECGAAAGQPCQPGCLNDTE